MNNTLFNSLIWKLLKEFVKEIIIIGIIIVIIKELPFKVSFNIKVEHIRRKSLEEKKSDFYLVKLIYH